MLYKRRSTFLSIFSFWIDCVFLNWMQIFFCVCVDRLCSPFQSSNRSNLMLSVSRSIYFLQLYIANCLCRSSTFLVVFCCWFIIAETVLFCLFLLSLFFPFFFPASDFPASILAIVANLFLPSFCFKSHTHTHTHAFLFIVIWSTLSVSQCGTTVQWWSALVCLLSCAAIDAAAAAAATTTAATSSQRGTIVSKATAKHHFIPFHFTDTHSQTQSPWHGDICHLKAS